MQPIPFVNHAVDVICAQILVRGTVFACGNGGSAAQADHFVAELTGRYAVDRPPLPAISLASNMAQITAIGNDYGFDYVFSRPLGALGKPGDVLVAISTSGNSPNVIEAMEVALEKGLYVIGLTGPHPSKLSTSGFTCEEYLKARLIAPTVARIQEEHMFLLHEIAGGVERRMFGDE